MLENLTAAQVRCNQLQQDLREARGRAMERDALIERLTAALSAFQELPSPLGLQTQPGPPEPSQAPPVAIPDDGLPLVTRPKRPGLAKAQ